MTLATVVIPTHDHGPLLRYSAASALGQTVDDLEVFVVGDGVPGATRELAAELAASDPRVRFFDNPKGHRHGELHRHAALQEASGAVVCYLADDDLWLPDHVERMRALLAESDFAHALPVRVDPDGRLGHFVVDLRLPYFRELLLGGSNRIPLSCGAHTLELYRRLPAGWRTTPAGTPTDLYMWQQILELPGCRVGSGWSPTALNFPSPDRGGWSTEQRLAELDEWSERLGDPERRYEFVRDLLAAIAAKHAELEAWAESLQAELNPASSR